MGKCILAGHPDAGNTKIASGIVYPESGQTTAQIQLGFEPKLAFYAPSTTRVCCGVSGFTGFTLSNNAAVAVFTSGKIISGNTLEFQDLTDDGAPWVAIG